MRLELWLATAHCQQTRERNEFTLLQIELSARINITKGKFNDNFSQSSAIAQNPEKEADNPKFMERKIGK